MQDHTEELDALRVQIDQVDSELVELLARRRQLAVKVGQVKSVAGLPIFVPEREAELLDKRRQQAEQHGLSGALIEDILRRTMRDSYQRQNHIGYRCANEAVGQVVIIGGRGRLGTFFVDMFRRSGYSVAVLEQDDWSGSEGLLSQAGLVIAAVPISVTVDVIESLSNLPPQCVLADFTSIKGPILNAMLKVHPGPVVGLHPMFGPDVSNLVRQTIIVCHGREAFQYQWLLQQFEIWGATCFEVTAARHDEAMSIIQVMRHFSTIAYGLHLKEESCELGPLIDMSSPIYRLELAMVGRIFAQDPKLYADIIFSDVATLPMMQRFAERFVDLLELVERGDKACFIEKFEDIARWFGEYSNTFLKESQHMLDSSIEVFRTGNKSEASSEPIMRTS